jgi:hypothetical protein
MEVAGVATGAAGLRFKTVTTGKVVGARGVPARYVSARQQACRLCRPLKGTWLTLLSFPGTSVPGSGLFRPFRDWFAEIEFAEKSNMHPCKPYTLSRVESRNPGR